MRNPDRDPLPAMSYTGVEIKPLAAGPTDEAIRERAHQIWLARNGAPGNPTLDWLQAEMELVAELRTGSPARASVKRAERARTSSQIEPLPEPARSFARGDAQPDRRRAA